MFFTNSLVLVTKTCCSSNFTNNQTLGTITAIAINDAVCAVLLRRLLLAYPTNRKRRIFETIKVERAIKTALMEKRYIAPKAYSPLPTASPYPTVHKGGIKAVAIATPKITLAIVPLLVFAT